MRETPPPDFKAIHHKARELVETDMVLAYAVAKELRKKLVGRESDAVKHDLMAHLAKSTWNEVAKLNGSENEPFYISRVLELFTETVILAHDILTEKIGYGSEISRSPKR